MFWLGILGEVLGWGDGYVRESSETTKGTHPGGEVSGEGIERSTVL